MNNNEIIAELFSLQDKEYAAFQAKLIPTAEAESIIGVRTPQLRAFAKVLCRDKEAEEFLSQLPHKYFEENQLHAFMISEEKDFDKCIESLEAFLPYVDNWATCDQLSPKAFKKNTDRLLPYIDKWIKSDKTYTVRFAVGMLMRYYLGEEFSTEYADEVARLRSEEYYVNMMIAWYFATALAKQYDLILPYFENRQLAVWTHNKAIQKSIESYRITKEQKEYLKTLKLPKSRTKNNIFKTEV